MTDLLGFHPSLVHRGVFKGVDLAFLATRLWQLDAMRAEGPIPKIRWRAYSHGGAWGTAFERRKLGRRIPTITMRLSASATVEDAVEVLLHELVHAALPVRTHHNQLFCRRLIACAREAFGLNLDTGSLLSLPAEKGCVAYAIDTVICKMMEAEGIGALIRAGHSFTPSPQETEEEIAERHKLAREARIAAREEHARTMLATWEKKLAAAKARTAKWRVKVRYYERRQEAAKRRSS